MDFKNPSKAQMTLSINSTLRQIPAWFPYLAGSLPAIWYFWLGFNGHLGPNPITKLEHLLGQFALYMLIFGLLLTPLKQFASINLLKFRRAIGLLAFSYVTLHLLVWLVFDVKVLSQIALDIVKRPYITIGMLGFIVMVPLALTSNQRSVKRLGRHWHILHKLTYLGCLLGSLHFVMLRKGFQLEPLIYLIVIVTLLSLRIIAKK